jgi:hypothetical protein
MDRKNHRHRSSIGLIAALIGLLGLLVANPTTDLLESTLPTPSQQ